MLESEHCFLDGAALAIHQFSPPEPVTLERFAPTCQQWIRFDHPVPNLLDRVYLPESRTCFLSIVVTRLLRPSVEVLVVAKGGALPQSSSSTAAVCEIDVKASYLTIFHALHREWFDLDKDTYVLPGLGEQAKEAVKSWCVARMPLGTRCGVVGGACYPDTRQA
jgi:hypothetical protein